MKKPLLKPSISTDASGDLGADWTFDKILARGIRFRKVSRVSALDTQAMLRAIDSHERNGSPLIIEDWHKHPEWNSDLFGMEWLLRNKGKQGARAPLPLLPSRH